MRPVAMAPFAVGVILTVLGCADAVSRSFHLPKGYSQLETPGDPTHVQIGFFINNMELTKTKLEVHMYFRQSWKDSRLAGLVAANTTRIVDPGIRHDIWTPDTFFPNAISAEAKYVPIPQFLVSVKDNGDIRFTQSIRAEFPRRGSLVSISVESYGYMTDELAFSWMSAPVDIGQGISLDGATLDNTTLHNCTQTYSFGAFSCLELNFVLS